MKKINVLVTAASRRVPLVRAFTEAVGKFGNGRVITTDINPLSPALYFGHKHHIVPLTTDRHYIPIIESICDVEDIGLVIPTIDDELPIFGKARSRFEHVGVRVAISSEQTGLICNDKYETFLFCRRNGISAPETILAKDIEGRNFQYPVVVKPRFGRGSVNVFNVQSDEQLRLFTNYVPDALVQDYAYGTEFTVDVLSNFKGNVISVVPRERLVIRAGVSDKGVTRRKLEVMDFAADVAERLQIVGASNIQCKWDGREVTLIEVNPRFSGGIPLTLASGADFPSWLLQMTAGIDVRPQIGKFQDGLAMMSFEESIFAKESDLLRRDTDKPRMLSRMRMVSSYVN
ncbi:MAG TPA: ATP-grasp domain-containing protein [Terriglobia bacterium]|nr:ATP-grasp domain-containing protein [Terriglobia bacterium]